MILSDATSAYWRKLIRIDEDVPKDFLDTCHSPLQILRPLYFFIIKMLCRFFCRVEIYGKENIPASPPYIIAPNHVSVLDQPVVSLAIGRDRKDLYSLASKHFFDNPLTRFFMRVGANVMRIDREEDFIPGLACAAKVLKLGKAVYINPEGTRSKTGELLPFKVGAGVLAVETGAPFVPVYIEGTFKVLRPGSFLPRPHKIKVYIGEPIRMDKYRKMKESGMAYDAYKAATDELYDRVVELKNKAKLS
jgi:1-acyl-sn-glycerol-3-phosphate acyltransferase